MLLLAGIAIAGLLGFWYGYASVLAAVLSAGWAGFGLLVLWQFVLFVPLGLGWASVAGAVAKRPLWVWLWGRLIRDAATAALPLAQLGGFAAGARAVTLAGVSWPQAAAATIVDVTAEVLGQIAFAALGLCLMIARRPGSAIAIPVAAGLGVGLTVMGLVVWLQLGGARLFTSLGRRIAGEGFGAAGSSFALVQTGLEAIYRRPGRMAAAVALHLLGWFGTAVGGYLAYRLLGADIGFIDALAIEGLLHAVLAVAFAVPGAWGVQEAAYAALGAAFGVPAELSLAVSLIRRARDLAIALPALLVWQGLEWRRVSANSRTDDNTAGRPDTPRIR
jgi:putative membrane protein